MVLASHTQAAIAKANFKQNVRLCVGINLDRRLKYWSE